METEFELGPYVDSVEEPALDVPPVVPVGRVGIVLGNPATEPGGKVNFVLGSGQDGDQKPVNVYAFFVPRENAPPIESQEPNFFFSSGAPVASVPIVDGQDHYQIKVNGVPPGFHFMRTVLEFPKRVAA